MYPQTESLENAQVSLTTLLEDATAGQVFSLIGPPAAGRRTLLRNLKQSLGEKRTCLQIDLPLPELDAASQAVATLWGCLSDKDPPASLLSNSQALARLTRDLADPIYQEGGCPVALVYAPWLRPSEVDRPTAVRMADGVNSLLAALATQCVLVLSAGCAWPLARRKFRIAKFAGSLEWIESEFPTNRECLLNLLETAPQSSRLELRLAFGLLEAGKSIDEICHNLLDQRPLESLAESLWASLVATNANNVLDAWLFLAVGRGPIPLRWLQEGLGLNAAELPLILHGLTYRDSDQVILHERLRVPALRALLDSSDGLQRWKELHRAHAELWAQERSSCLQGVRGQQFIFADLQFVYHAIESGCKLDAVEDRLWFQEQLCLLGRTLSKRHHRYQEAFQCFRRACEIDPSDAYAWHYASYNNSRTADCISKIVEDGYSKAVELEPGQLWYHQRLVRWLLSRGWIHRAQLAWLDSLRQTTDSADPDEPSVYFYHNLHWLVAERALESGALEFAANVLREIPTKVFQLDENLHGCKRKLEILQLAEGNRLVRPYQVACKLGANNLLNQPELLSRRLPLEGELRQWYAARIEEVEDGKLHLLLGIPPSAAYPEGRLLRSEMTQMVYDGSTQDERFAELIPGRYLEIGEYGEHRKGLIRVFRLESSTKEGERSAVVNR